MQKIISSQRKFFETNITKSIDFRTEQLTLLKKVLEENEDALNNAIFADFKKSSFDNYIYELAWIYRDIDEALKKIRTWSKTKPVRTNLVNFPAKSYVVLEPLGLSLIIGPWNYPYQLTLSPIIASISAGNTIILKPSELAVNVGQVLSKIISENFNPNYFAVITGGVFETTELLKNKFDKIFFTGSVPVGKIVYKAAAEHLTPVTLELGGKSPAIFTDEMDLKMGVKRLVWAKFVNSGQTCIAPDYLLVPKSKQKQVLELIKSEIIKHKYAVENKNYVQIINNKNTTRLVNLIDQSEVYFGGKHNLDQRLIEPTVLTNVSFDDDIMKEEIFGPLLPVISYDDLDAEIKNIKALPKPLACYVFSKNKKVIESLLNQIPFGGGCVNDAIMQITNSNFGFGGIGESGLGNYHGETGFKTFSHLKSIIDKPTWFETNIKYYQHSNKKLKLFNLLLGTFLKRSNLK